MNNLYGSDTRLIEAGFPCHQVGAETQRERDTGKAPPVNRLGSRGFTFEVYQAGGCEPSTRRTYRHKGRSVLANGG